MIQLKPHLWLQAHSLVFIACIPLRPAVSDRLWLGWSQFPSSILLLFHAFSWHPVIPLQLLIFTWAISKRNSGTDACMVCLRLCFGPFIHYSTDVHVDETQHGPAEECIKLPFFLHSALSMHTSGAEGENKMRVIFRKLERWQAAYMQLSLQSSQSSC